MVELLMQSRVRHLREADGFTLIEVMVSITILSIGILVLGGLLLRSSRTAEVASAVSYRTALIAAQAAHYDAIPFDQLVAGTTCTTVTTGPLPHTLCTIVTDVSAKVRLVTVRLRPTVDPLLQADSVMFERSISGNGTPLKTP